MKRLNIPVFDTERIRDGFFVDVLDEGWKLILPGKVSATEELRLRNENMEDNTFNRVSTSSGLFPMLHNPLTNPNLVMTNQQNVSRVVGKAMLVTGTFQLAEVNDRFVNHGVFDLGGEDIVKTFWDRDIAGCMELFYNWFTDNELRAPEMNGELVNNGNTLKAQGILLKSLSYAEAIERFFCCLLPAEEGATVTVYPTGHFKVKGAVLYVDRDTLTLKERPLFNEGVHYIFNYLYVEERQRTHPLPPESRYNDVTLSERSGAALKSRLADLSQARLSAIPTFEEIDWVRHVPISNHLGAFFNIVKILPKEDPRDHRALFSYGYDESAVYWEEIFQVDFSFDNLGLIPVGRDGGGLGEVIVNVTTKRVTIRGNVVNSHCQKINEGTYSLSQCKAIRSLSRFANGALKPPSTSRYMNRRIGVINTETHKVKLHYIPNPKWTSYQEINGEIIITLRPMTIDDNYLHYCSFSSYWIPVEDPVPERKLQLKYGDYFYYNELAQAGVYSLENGFTRSMLSDFSKLHPDVGVTIDVSWYPWRWETSKGHYIPPVLINCNIMDTYYQMKHWRGESSQWNTGIFEYVNRLWWAFDTSDTPRIRTEFNGSSHYIPDFSRQEWKVTLPTNQTLGYIPWLSSVAFVEMNPEDSWRKGLFEVNEGAGISNTFISFDDSHEHCYLALNRENGTTGERFVHIRVGDVETNHRTESPDDIQESGDYLVRESQIETLKIKGRSLYRGEKRAMRRGLRQYQEISQPILPSVILDYSWTMGSNILIPHGIGVSRINTDNSGRISIDELPEGRIQSNLNGVLELKPTGVPFIVSRLKSSDLVFRVSGERTVSENIRGSVISGNRGFDQWQGDVLGITATPVTNVPITPHPLNPHFPPSLELLKINLDLGFDNREHLFSTFVMDANHTGMSINSDMKNFVNGLSFQPTAIPHLEYTGDPNTSYFRYPGYSRYPDFSNPDNITSAETTYFDGGFTVCAIVYKDGRIIRKNATLQQVLDNDPKAFLLPITADIPDVVVNNRLGPQNGKQEEYNRLVRSNNRVHYRFNAFRYLSAEGQTRTKDNPIAFASNREEWIGFDRALVTPAEYVRQNPGLDILGKTVSERYGSSKRIFFRPLSDNPYHLQLHMNLDYIRPVPGDYTYLDGELADKIWWNPETNGWESGTGLCFDIEFATFHSFEGEYGRYLDWLAWWLGGNNQNPNIIRPTTSQYRSDSRAFLNGLSPTLGSI